MSAEHNKNHKKLGVYYTMKTITDGYAEALAELSKQKENIVVLSADSTEKTGIKQFAQKHPNRFVQCGKAKQSLIGIAAGIATEGKIAFANTCITENCDQLRLIAHKKLNVKIVDADSSEEDVAIARAFPEFTIIIPADYHEAKKAAIAAAVMKGPVYLRLGKDKGAVTTEKTPFTIGRVEIIRAGKDCTILACGTALAEAIKAAEKLSQQEIECTVLNCHTIQPLDRHAVTSSARLTGCIVTAEEQRGLGPAAAELLSEYLPVPVKMCTADSIEIAKAAKDAVLLKCETICPEIPEEHGRMLAPGIQPELYFKLHGGGAIKSIPGLKKALLEMSNETFSYHCNDHRNDFGNWVKDVFREPLLAKQIEKSKTRIGMAIAITRWLK